MSPIVRLGDASIWYAGKRLSHDLDPPLLLIHGAGGSHLSWPGQMRNIPGTTVLALDLPGHGRSIGPELDTIEGFARVVAGFMDRLDLGQVILCGYSMGGAIAQWLALYEPDRVKGLILIATAARLGVSPALMKEFSQNPERALRLMADWSFGPDASQQIVDMSIQVMGEMAASVIMKDLQACDRFDIRDRLADIRVPALVVAGAIDRMVPLKYARYLADHLEQGCLHVVENAGHMVALQRPESVASAVQKFIRRFNKCDKSGVPACRPRDGNAI